MIVQILVGAFIVLGLFLLFVATRPAAFRIERSRQIQAPSHVVFAIVNDLHQWGRWSPYEKLDPSMKKTFSGAEKGPGSSYAWNGNNRAGEGRLTIVESKPDEAVKLDLEFTRPFRAQNKVTFAFKPQANQTTVSWIMEGSSNFVGKIFHMCMNLDKLCGKDFEEGLANLDSIAQAESRG